MLTEIQEAELAVIRGKIRQYMSDKRLWHTCAVEEEIGSLARIYCPDAEFELRVAGILHDITKELKTREQVALCHEFNIEYTEQELLSPKIFHAKTAIPVIKRDFPEYAKLHAVEAIRWHTTGRKEMNLYDKLLYLADWIEPTRTFNLCKELRDFFYNNIKSANSLEEKGKVLLDTLIKSFDMTINLLIDEGAIIHPDTLDARNYFIAEAIGAGTERE